MANKRLEEIVRDTLEELDEDDDLYEKLKDSEAFLELINQLLREDQGIRDQIKKAIKGYISPEDDNESPVDAVLSDAQEFDEVVVGVLEDDEVKKSIRIAIQAYIQPKDDEDSPIWASIEDTRDLEQAIEEALAHEDTKSALRQAIARACSQDEFVDKIVEDYDPSGEDYPEVITNIFKNDPQAQAALGKRVVSIIDSGDMDNSIGNDLENADFVEPINQSFSSPNVQEALQKRVVQCISDSEKLAETIEPILQRADLSGLVTRVLTVDKITSTLEGGTITQETLLPAVVEALGKTEIFKEQVVHSLEKLARLGRLDTLIGKIVESVITGEESELTRSLKDATTPLLKDIFLRGLELYKKESSTQSGSFYR